MKEKAKQENNSGAKLNYKKKNEMIWKMQKIKRLAMQRSIRNKNYKNVLNFEGTWPISHVKRINNQIFDSYENVFGPGKKAYTPHIIQYQLKTYLKN